MCLQLSGGWSLLRYRYSGQDSLFWLFSFSLLILGSRKFSSPGRSQALGITNCFHEVAAQRERPARSPTKGWVLKGQAAQDGQRPLGERLSFFFEKGLFRGLCFCRLFSSGSGFLQMRSERIFSAAAILWDNARTYNL